MRATIPFQAVNIIHRNLSDHYVFIFCLCSLVNAGWDVWARAMRRVRVPRSMFALYDVVVARRRLLPPLLNRKSTERRPRPNERPPCPAPPLPPPPTYFGRDLGDWARPSLFLLVFPLLRRPLLPAPARCLLFLGGVWRDESPLSHSPSVHPTGQRGEMAPSRSWTWSPPRLPPTALFVESGRHLARPVTNPRAMSDGLAAAHAPVSLPPLPSSSDMRRVPQENVMSRHRRRFMKYREGKGAGGTNRASRNIFQHSTFAAVDIHATRGPSVWGKAMSCACLLQRCARGWSPSPLPTDKDRLRVACKAARKRG